MVLRGRLARRQRERAEVRLKILDAARELFLGGGEEAVTLRRVAEEIEYSATAIYLHFPDKETLIQELCATDFAVYSRVLQQAERITDPIARLRKVAMGYVEFGLLYPSHYRAMFLALPGRKSARKRVVAKTKVNDDEQPKGSPTLRDPYDFLQTAVFKAMAAGCFKPQYRDVAMIAQTVWSGLHGVLSLHLVRARYPAVSWRSVQEGADLIVECLVHGLTVEDA